MDETLDEIRKIPSYILRLLDLLRGSLSRKRLGILILGAMAVFLVSLPIIAQTKTYPVAVVEGNSMIPNLHSGDLVFYSVPKSPLRNGSIIVFVQSDTAIGLFDALYKPIVIHRIISVGQDPNGIVSYQTKGDNNQAADPFVTDRANVLGTPVVVLPFLGFPILFFKSSYGMLTVVALVSLYFFSGVDTRTAEEDARRRLLAVFAKHSLNGEISSSQFERVNMAFQYGEVMPLEEVRNPMTISVINWLKAGGLENDWKEELVECPSCSNLSFHVVSEHADVLICPSCEGNVDETPQTGSNAAESSGKQDEQSELIHPEDPEPSNLGTGLVQEPFQDQNNDTRTETSFEEATSQLTDEIAKLLYERTPIGQIKDENTQRERGKSRTRRKPHPDLDRHYSTE